MDELIRKDQGLYKKYEELLLKRDQLYREAGSISTAYIREFGALMIEDFELKVECIKKKKMIAYCQAAVNRGQAIDVESMKKEIEMSMKLYTMQLQKMLEDKKRADKASKSPLYRIERAKRIYRRLAKLVHPDLNPKTEEDQELSDLWNRIVIAYNCNDDKELENLEILVLAYLKKAGIPTETPDIENLEERIEKLEMEINQILTTEPYIYKEFFESKERIAARKAELREEIEDYREYSESLSEMLLYLMCEEGTVFTWHVN